MFLKCLTHLKEKIAALFAAFTALFTALFVNAAVQIVQWVCSHASIWIPAFRSLSFETVFEAFHSKPVRQIDCCAASELGQTRCPHTYIPSCIKLRLSKCRRDSEKALHASVGSSQ
jgi:hypothetical protein